MTRSLLPVSCDVFLIERRWLVTAGAWPQQRRHCTNPVLPCRLCSQPHRSNFTLSVLVTHHVKRLHPVL